MKLLSLDQSSHTSGYAIFSDENLTSYGKFTFNDTDMGIRLNKIRKKVKELIEQNNIDTIVIEDIQLQGNVTNNVQTFKTLAEVFGVIYELTTDMNIPCSCVLASSWKSTLGIKGKTRPEQKRNAQNFVKTTYNVLVTQDEADAICIGCHTVKKNLNFNWTD